MGLIYETSIWAFLFITLMAGGGAAFMIGRASAKVWKPFWQAAASVMLLTGAIRFLHWALFAGATLASWREAQGSLFSLHYYFVDAAILFVFAALGFRLQRRSQMLRQYSWLTESAGPLSWRVHENATTQP
jgi:cation transport ATPase